MENNDSVITCDEIINAAAKSHDDTPETVSNDSINKKTNSKIDHFSHYSISDHILIIVNNHCYCYSIKHRLKCIKKYIIILII